MSSGAWVTRGHGSEMESEVFCHSKIKLKDKLQIKKNKYCSRVPVPFGFEESVPQMSWQDKLFSLG